MSDHVNKVVLVGNLGADAELRFGQSGTAVLKLRVVTNERWTSRDGKPGERSDWHNVVLFGDRAQELAPGLRKGSRVVVEGSLQTRDYVDKAGEKRHVTEVNAKNVMLLVEPRGGGRERASGSVASGYGRGVAATQRPYADPPPPTEGDDIPF
jgi:single-strand DNA-binding protein